MHIIANSPRLMMTIKIHIILKKNSLVKKSFTHETTKL